MSELDAWGQRDSLSNRLDRTMARNRREVAREVILANDQSVAMSELTQSLVEQVGNFEDWRRQFIGNDEVKHQLSMPFELKLVQKLAEIQDGMFSTPKRFL